MCKYLKIFLLLCLLSSASFYASASSGACEESFEKSVVEQGSKVLDGKTNNNLSISEVNELVNHLENNVFVALQRATTNQNIAVRLEALKEINKLGIQLIQLIERVLNHSDVEARQEVLKLPVKLLYNVIITNITNIININNLQGSHIEMKNQVKQVTIPLLRYLLPLVNKSMCNKTLNPSVVYLRIHVLSLQMWMDFKDNVKGS